MAYSSARQRNVRRAARAAAREAGLSLEEWVDTLFEDSGAGDDDFDLGQPGQGSRPAADDRTAMRLLSHRLDSIESLLADMATRGGKGGNADGAALVRDIQNAMSSDRKDGRGLAGGLARVVGEDLPISRNAASDALKEIGTRLDRISSNLAAAQKSQPQGEAAVSRLEQRLDDISRQLKTRSEQPKSTDAAIAAQTKRLEQKLDSMSKQFRSAPRPVAHARLASTPSPRTIPTTDPELTRRIGGIDSAVSQILRRQKDLDSEARTAKSDSGRKAEIAAIREDIARLAAHVDNASDRIGSTLEQRLASLSGQLDTATRSELAAIREEINHLGARIDNGTKTNISALREALNRMAAMNQPADLERIEGKLVEIASAVSESGHGGSDIAQALASRLDALTQRIEDIAAGGAGTLTPDNANAIERQLADLGSEIRARADAGPQALKTIAMQFDRMNSRLEEIASQSGSSGVETLNTRIDELTRQISGLNEAGGAGAYDTSSFEALEARIAGLADRLETMSVHGGGDGASEAVGELATQVARLAEMVEESDRRRPNPPNIDQAMGELVRRVEQVRTSAIDAAKHAAQEVAASIGRGGANSADTMSINNLKHELNALRAASESSSTRTEQTLEVMRDVLTTIVERLGEIEEDGAAPAQQASGDRPIYALSDTAADALDDEFDTDLPEDFGAAMPDAPLQDRAPAQQPAAEEDHEPVPVESDPAYMNLPETAEAEDDSPIPVMAGDDTAGDDGDDAHLPLAPGASAAAALPQPQRRPKPDPLPASERASDADRQDFIAAARRAAQKAAAEGDARSITGGGKDKSRLRKPLVMVSAALIVIVGSLKLYNMVFSEDETANEPVAEQNSLPAGDVPTLASPVEPEAAAPEAAAPAEPAETPEPAAPAEAEAESATTPADTGMEPAPVAPVESAPVGGDAGEVPASGRDGGAPAEDAPENPDLSAAEPKTPRVIEMTTNSIAKGPRLDASQAVKEAEALQASLTQLPAGIGPEGLRRAAIDGEPSAQFEVASRYMQGRGIAQDLKAAADWYQRAAAQGLAPAQYRLGSLYEKGHGVTRDISMAEMWYMRAADQGNRKAMHNLAVLNAQGAKGEPDFAEAARWFRQAAEHGLRDSQFNLAILYARGLGIDADSKEAYKWFAIAASQGDREAGAKRDEIAASLGADEVAVAKRMARNWEATPLVDAANFVKAETAWEGAGLDDALDPKVVVRATQTMLNQLGFDAGPADGMMGPRTRDAIKAFQTANGMIPTGIATPDLLTSLKNATG